MSDEDYILISRELEEKGLIWEPEIGDEVIERRDDAKISILVDPHGLSPSELREVYTWLPTVEQLVDEIEARQGIIFHAGAVHSSRYKTVVKTTTGMVEEDAESLRLAFGKALTSLVAEEPMLDAQGYH